MRTMGLMILGVCIAFVASPAMGQQPCGDRADILRELESQFRETVRLRMLDKQGRMGEITASPSGSWTALVTRPDGVTCMGGSGDGVEFTPRQPEGKPS